MKPHAAALRRRPRPSASVAPKPGLTIQAESLYEIANELPPLFVRYGQEFKKVEGVISDPDWSQLFRMTAAGTLKVTTARDKGTLIGFAFSVVGPHLMYKNTCHGITIAVWLDKAYRFGWFPLKFLRRNLELLKEYGVKRAAIARDAMTPRLGVVYERLGYRVDEVSYARAL